MTDNFDYDITGFVSFPEMIDRSYQCVDIGETMVYMIAFENRNHHMVQNIPNVGEFNGDDMSNNSIGLSKMDNEDDLIEYLKNEEINIKNYYFKNKSKFKVISSILVGWSKFSYYSQSGIEPWCCAFKDLTSEGKRLYYSLKKLHNNSEIRILTFSKV